jgi:hypothetical protein
MGFNWKMSFGGGGGVGSNRRNALNGISSGIWFDWMYVLWWRGVGSNHRPSDYEPDELPLLYPATCPYTVWKIRQSQFSEKKSFLLLILQLLLQNLQSKFWCQWVESNRRPQGYESCALPLSYIGTWWVKSPVPPQADTLASKVYASCSATGGYIGI